MKDFLDKLVKECEVDYRHSKWVYNGYPSEFHLDKLQLNESRLKVARYYQRNINANHPKWYLQMHLERNFNEADNKYIAYHQNVAYKGITMEILNFINQV